MTFHGDKISGRVRRFRHYTDGFSGREVYRESSAYYDLHSFPEGVRMDKDDLQVLECSRKMRGACCPSRWFP